MKILPGEARAPSHVQFGRRLTEVVVGEGLELDHNALADELLGYVDVLLARADAPVDSPYLDLQECATAYLARALEMEMLIHNEERNRKVVRGHPLYQFRTGSLRSFIEMAKKMADLGSRRLSAEQLLSNQRYDAGENY
jgi:hypothetical protein